MAHPSKPYKEHLFERLRDPEEAGGYLGACLEESKDSGGVPAETVAMCLRDIVEAWNLPITIELKRET